MYDQEYEILQKCNGRRANQCHFGGKNAIAVAILVRVLAKMSK